MMVRQEVKAVCARIIARLLMVNNFYSRKSKYTER